MKKPKHTIKRYGLIANVEKPFCRLGVPRAVELIRKLDGDVTVDTVTAGLLRGAVNVEPDYLAVARTVDVLLVFGGDGTMLRVGRDTAGSGTPIFGVNTGHLGFLTAVNVRQMPAALQQIAAGSCRVVNRAVIEASGRIDGHKFHLTALNDMVISRGAASRVIELEVKVNGEMLTRYRADGLIISTPTGSTAYSLSAGGAIVSPESEVFTLTPICPHTLTNRSVIVSLKSRLQVTVLSEKPATILTADGQVPQELAKGVQVNVRRSRLQVRLLQLESHSFFETLRAKLNWSGSNL